MPFYYLHTDGDLIYRAFDVEADSPFVQHIWPCDTRNRADAWTIVLEGLALGASLDRCKELADHWELTPQDLTEFMARVRKPSKLARNGLYKFLELIVGVNPDEWLNWLASTPKGQAPDFSTMPAKQ